MYVNIYMERESDREGEREGAREREREGERERERARWIYIDRWIYIGMRSVRQRSDLIVKEAVQAEIARGGR